MYLQKSGNVHPTPSLQPFEQGLSSLKSGGSFLWKLGFSRPGSDFIRAKGATRGFHSDRLYAIP